MSDPAIEEALYDSTSMRKFAGLSLAHGAIPDETTILNFRHLLERYGLTHQILLAVNAYLGEKGLLPRHGIIVNATINDAPSSTKNGAGEREEMQGVGIKWHIAMPPGKRSWLDKTSKLGEMLDKIEKRKAGVRAKVEHPFRVIKLPFGFTKARYRGLPQNAAKLNTLFALSTL